MFHVVLIARLRRSSITSRRRVRALPPWLRVHPIAFLPMAVLMPVAYLLLTPLGLFTLDSSSWETRGHQARSPRSSGAPMIVAAHQPHYLPWLGYLDKLAKADLFVVMDDLQYEAQNFQNRQRVKLNDGAHVADGAARARRAGRSHLRQAHRQRAAAATPALAAPHVAHARDPLSAARRTSRATPTSSATSTRAVGRACSSSTCTCSTSRARWLGITTPIVRASSLGLAGQKTDRIIDMCKKVGARAYLSGRRRLDGLPRCRAASAAPASA